MCSPKNVHTTTFKIGRLGGQTPIHIDKYRLLFLYEFIPSYKSHFEKNSIINIFGHARVDNYRLFNYLTYFFTILFFFFFHLCQLIANLNILIQKILTLEFNLNLATLDCKSKHY